MGACFENMEELAAYLNVSRNWVTKQLKAGMMPGKKVGRRWLVKRITIDEWLKSA